MDGENIFENLYYLVWDGRRGLEIRFGKLQIIIIIVGGGGGICMKLLSLGSALR